MADTSNLWFLMTVVGVIILGAALAYGLMRNRRMTHGQKDLSERSTERLYDAEQRDPAN